MGGRNLTRVPADDGGRGAKFSPPLPAHKARRQYSVIVSPLQAINSGEKLNR